MEQYSKFAELLTQGVRSIKAIEDKPLQQIHDELGYEIGRDGGSAIQHWRRGSNLPNNEDIAKLATAIVQRDAASKQWLGDFLKAGHYEDAKQLVETLFPAEFVEPIEVPTIAKPSEPIIPHVIAIEPVGIPAKKPAPFDKWLASGLSLIFIVSLLVFIFPRIQRNLAPVGLKNAGFESASLPPWQQHDECNLNLRLLQDRQLAYSGTQFVTASSDSPDCYSFYQDGNFLLEKGQTYNFSIWARTADQSYQEIGVVLWTGEQVLGNFKWSKTENSNPQFLIGGDQWRCFEASVTIANDSPNTAIRAELYVPAEINVDIYFDDATLDVGSRPTCEPQTIGYAESFEYSTALRNWPSIGDCKMHTKNDPRAYEGATYLQVSKDTGCVSALRPLRFPTINPGSYTLSAWVRSPDGGLRDVELAMWARGGIQQEHAASRLRVYGDQWHCVETILNIDYPDHNELVLNYIYKTLLKIRQPI